MADRDATGTVDFFNDTGGYGFVETQAADEDVFFHMEDVGGPDLKEGQKVGFDVHWTEKGPRATNLVRDPGGSGDSSGSGIVNGVKERATSLFDSSDASSAEHDPTDSDASSAEHDPADYDAVGTVDFFNDTGGYGFVETPAADEDVFVHMEDVDGPDLKEGEKIALSIEAADKGPRAISILRDPPSTVQQVIEVSEDARDSTDAPTETTDDNPTTVYTPDDPTRVYTADETAVECPECGTHLSDGDAMNFCSKCGGDLP